MRLSDENLRGRTVIGADGRAIGEVAAIFLDSEKWAVEALQIKLRKEIADRVGAARGMFHAGTIEVPVTLIQSVGDAVVLAVEVDGLRRSSESAEPANASLH
jgi:sporulation protein YlmC with PRC-barrel domain